MPACNLRCNLRCKLYSGTKAQILTYLQQGIALALMTHANARGLVYSSMRAHIDESKNKQLEATAEEPVALAAYYVCPHTFYVCHCMCAHAFMCVSAYLFCISNHCVWWEGPRVCVCVCVCVCVSMYVCADAAAS
jgi:hypothetical protein